MESTYDIYTTTTEAWDAMHQAILAAEKSIYWEIYIFVDDEVGEKFLQTLENKTRSGVDVKLILDGLGSFGLSGRRFDRLKAAGVDVRFFQERKPWRGLSRLFSRSHRKVLIIDEKIGFIGGVNVQKQMKDWLDIHLKIEGKVVRSLLRSFARMYILCGGEKQKVKHLLKYKFRISDKSRFRFIFDQGYDEKSNAREKYSEALLKARERVILFSPYYFPDKEFLKALWNARKRGIRVDLLIPFRTDLRIVTYAAYAWFALMKRYGVKVHLIKSMMHGKGVVVDDDWAMVGSSNLEHTSFYDSYEANVQIYDKEFVKKIKIILEKWMKKSVSLENMNWEKRGVWQRIQEWVAIKLYTLWHRRAEFKFYEDEFQTQSTTRRSDASEKS